MGFLGSEAASLKTPTSSSWGVWGMLLAPPELVGYFTAHETHINDPQTKIFGHR